MKDFFYLLEHFRAKNQKDGGELQDKVVVKSEGYKTMSQVLDISESIVQLFIEHGKSITRLQTCCFTDRPTMRETCGNSGEAADIQRSCMINCRDNYG